ncbi:LPXTG cell wall anchor domain-containing protein [Eleftheria terrae]|uniref:LPXTG cell wall anchor domain-containing protein n=1 Tax=Eleftheria terrae TaxID=1597781 RepID=UPI00263ADCB6|nr:LPXTG cell wall anchor domain-containing protein [Eleftheria terrae]WKB55890.1 LPXTG cell wall anchor domain-containing protein [Eleftheria terrae]
MGRIKTLGLALLLILVLAVSGCIVVTLAILPNDASIDEGWAYSWAGMAAGAILGGLAFWWSRRRKVQPHH